MIIALENGHGIDTAGKRSPIWSDGKQLLEWQFNRQIVDKLDYKLVWLGINTLIVTPEEKDISNSERLKRINQMWQKDKQSFGVSIHANACDGKPTANGWEVWSNTKEDDSDVLGSFIYLAFEKLPFSLRKKDAKDKVKDKDFTVLMAKCPMVLTENGFMTNEKDCRYMMSEEGQEAIAEAHVQGILNFIKYKKYGC